MVDALRELVEPDGMHEGFSKPYWQIVNDTPAVTIEHVKLWRLLESVKSP